MEYRLKMMIAGSFAVWVPVTSAAQAAPGVVDPGKVFRLKPDQGTGGHEVIAPDVRQHRRGD